MGLDIITIPCLSDNYAFLARDTQTGDVALFDAPEAAPILGELEAHGWKLNDIFLTHHHGDHIDGVAAIVAETGARVTGAKADAHRLPPLDRALRPGDSVAVGQSNGTVLDVSGHTVGHIAYHFAGAGAAFTGDSLMALGCGRVFEGTPEQMWQSLSQFLDMDDDTVICSGHEYTAANGRFAETIEPDNPDLRARIAEIAGKRAQNQPTVPSILGQEKATNPFLRVSSPAIRQRLNMADKADFEVFAEVRRRKDNF